MEMPYLVIVCLVAPILLTPMIQSGAPPLAAQDYLLQQPVQVLNVA
jgi:hypothetical protein